MDYYRYFQSYDNYFWQWEEEGEVLAVPGAGTIAYKAYVGEIFRKLIPQGIPPFGSLLLSIIVTNPEGEDSFELVHSILTQAINENKKADLSLLNNASAFLRLLLQLPQQYKEGEKRFLLFQTLFANCHNILSVINSNRVCGVYFSDRQDKGAVLRKNPFSYLVLKKDLKTLEVLSYKFKKVEDILREMASEKELPEELLLPETNEEAESKEKDFVEELVENSKTFHIGTLIRRLWSGLNIPVHASQPSQQPLGGISDLTNKGDFDKLLLSEFANDDLVFLSRLANNEALYISREIPPANNDFQRIILIDVSLKNWGTPKTIAYAIMLAIARHPKTSIDSSVYVIGDEFHPISIESIHTIIEGLQLLETGLHAANGLTAFFKEFPVHKNREVFVITTHSTLKQPAMLKAMNDHHAHVNYWIHADVEGYVDVYKKQQSSKKHLQHFQLPLDELWRKEIKRPETTKVEKLFIENRSPLLYRNSVNTKKILSASDGEIFEITGDKRVLKFHDKSLGLFQKGWELVSEDLPKGIVDAEIGLSKNGEYVLLLFVPQNKEIFLLNINTGAQSAFSFGEWRTNESQAAFFMEDKFYYKSSFLHYYSIDLDGKVEIVAPVDIKLFEERGEALKLLVQKFSYAQSPFKNVNDLFLNQDLGLVFNIHELILNPGKHIKLELTNNREKFLEAKRINDKEFEFPEGSKVEIDRSGLIILKSSNKEIPFIYIPSYIDYSLGVATSGFFAGNEYYYAEPQWEVLLKEASTDKINTIKLVKEHTELGLMDAKIIVEDTPSTIKKYCSETKARTIKTILENNGSKVEIRPVKTRRNFDQLEKMSTEVFFTKYIKAFIYNIKANGTTH
jgi:ribosomal protein L7/L12